MTAANRELKRVARAHRRLSSADSFDDAEDAWADFLAHANKVYLKLRAACHGQGLDWMWWRKIMDERRDDPLLAYIHHARNSDTHRLEETVEWIPIGAHTVQVPGLGDVATGPHLRALSVTDKDVVYLPPTEHFGGPIPYPQADAISALATRYLDELVIAATFRLR